MTDFAKAAAQAAELIDLDVLALVAKADQVAEVARLEAEGDSIAAYWAGSASASVMHHYRRGAFTTVRA
jgi:hypothetical protein